MSKPRLEISTLQETIAPPVVLGASRESLCFLDKKFHPRSNLDEATTETLCFPAGFILLDAI